MNARPLAVALAWAVCSLHSAARGEVVYHEKFDHYGFSMPGSTESCIMAEWPPSLKHLEFRPTKPDSVYKGGFFKLPKEAQGLTDYEFEFRFRFPKDGPKALDFRLEFLAGTGGKQPDYTNCTLRISDDTSGVLGVGRFQPRLPATRTPMKETALHPLLGGLFYRCVVRVQAKSLAAFIEGMGRSVRIGGAEVSGGPLAGFNFSGASASDLDDIIARLGGVAGEDEARLDFSYADVVSLVQSMHASGKLVGQTLDRQQVPITLVIEEETGVSVEDVMKAPRIPETQRPQDDRPDVTAPQIPDSDQPLPAATTKPAGRSN